MSRSRNRSVHVHVPQSKGWIWISLSIGAALIINQFLWAGQVNHARQAQEAALDRYHRTEILLEQATAMARDRLEAINALQTHLQAQIRAVQERVSEPIVIEQSAPPINSNRTLHGFVCSDSGCTLTPLPTRLMGGGIYIGNSRFAPDCTPVDNEQRVAREPGTERGLVWRGGGTTATVPASRVR